MSSSLFLSLRQGRSFTPRGEGEAALETAQGSVLFRDLTPATLKALQRLGSEGEYEGRLTEPILLADGAEGLAKFHSLLKRLTRKRLLLYSARLGDKWLATLTPISPYCEVASRAVDPGRKYVLSRFAYTRREQGDVVLESPLSHARITLQDWRAAALVYALAQPRHMGDLGEQIPALPDEAADQLMTLMINARVILGLEDQEGTPEDESGALQAWEFHDLLFHARSRGGRHDYQSGGTYRLAGRVSPPPVLKTVRPDESFALYRPDLDRLEREDPPFARVQEARRSIREYADEPISDRQLGEFLYRVGRVADYWQTETQTPRGLIKMDLAARPYPAGGALYELELYVAARACENLASGMYYYDPQHHGLNRLSCEAAYFSQLLTDAGQAAGIADERIQVLIIIAARFQRISWKYASIAYALTLKHVGVLYQTMYLVAAAMDLAPCGVGSGDSDLFARAAGMDYYEETSVGEFLLGSKAPSA
jgi:SagB-type dehydrogenase family enzyme